MAQWERPADWVACLLDGKGQMIASTGPQAAPPGPTCAGSGPVARTAESGWSVVAASGPGVHQATFWRVQAALALGALGLLAAGLLLARWLGQRIAEPIQALVGPALAIGRGEAATIAPGPLRETGALAQALMQAQDLLARREAARRQAEASDKESQARLVLALEAGGIGHWEFDLRSGTARMSAEHDRCFGHAPVAWTLDLWLDRVHSADRPRVRGSLERAMHEGRVWHEEFRVTWPDGSEPWLAVRGRCILEAGVPVRLVGVVADITLRRQALELQHQRQELERENRRLQEEVEHRGRFFAGMSHELRTPLNAVLGFTQLLQADATVAASPRALAYVGHISDAGHHLLSLIGDVLDLAKIEAGRLEFTPQAVQARDLCAGVLQMLQPLADARQVTLRLESDADLPALMLDPLRLRQMLYNLLSNAIKFTHPGTCVQLRVTGASDGHVRFEVQDQGPGIPGETHERLFRAFGQLAEGRAQGRAGTRLGLALTRQLAELQGGGVELRSATGQGSTFVITLPMVQHG
jgi:PAS domain S-box-containing protein